MIVAYHLISFVNAIYNSNTRIQFHLKVIIFIDYTVVVKILPDTIISLVWG